MTRFRTLAVAGLERARTAKPVTWLTVIGVLLLPAVVGGVLVAALYNPTERLDNMSAAIVNLDEPVTVQGQYTPLGRQVAAGLVEGSDDLDSNLTWVLSNEDDAADGIADGTYQAVVTIPENFSAAATSAGQSLSGSDTRPERATIEVVTAPDARIVDQAITAQIASVAASVTGQMLSEATLSNVFVGYSTLGDQLGDAADGAGQLADGAREAQDGATQLSGGAGQLAGGVSQLGAGAGELAGGAAQAASGAQQLGDGAGQLAGGAGQLSGGAQQLGDGAAEIAGNMRGIADGMAGIGTGAGDLANGVQQIADGNRQLADGAQQLVDGIRGGVEYVRDQDIAGQLNRAATQLTESAAAFAELADRCDPTQDAAYCAQLRELADAATASASQAASNLGAVAGRVPELQQRLDGAVGEAQGFTDGLTALADGGDEAAAGARELAAGAGGLADGAYQLADGTDGIAAGAYGLAGGARDLQDGAGQIAGGVNGLAGGVGQLAQGARGLATGAGALSSGADELADGVSQLGEGIGALGGGADELADGLGQAADALPSFSDAEAERLASVLAEPVSASSGEGMAMFGASAVPLLVAAVMWFGGLGTFVAMRSFTARTLTSRRASATLAVAALLPAAIIGAAQGLLVAIVVQIVMGYDAGTAAALLGLCVLIGVAFAAIHQALVAVLGGAGRWVGAIIGASIVATGVVSTLPAWLARAASFLPAAPAYDALLGVVADTGRTGAAIAGLLVWAVLAFVATTIAVARRRTLPARAILAPSPA
ncbi:YhgE/Pip domain-containing protein [Microbacterium album]|uniref:ABC-2 type transporter transmembrane domain-containing protein n=1 Tax=Microbacterium album TaxID=2053191 RepID=A0A917MKR6_9MICO|nr:YhgE/Pip family protein [Microbacterium album]GGH36301.1 hypothetical protein GCM10010921_05370 [Microbacterium album]